MNNVLETCNRFCSGCGLCASICPVQAIKMELREGSFRPAVNHDCISCGKCKRFCPNLLPDKCNYEEFQYYYWGHSLNAEHRLEAASGGITSELLAYLAHKKYVDYIVTADEYHDDQNGGFCILDSDSIFERAGSNYCPMNLGAALQEISKREGTCAIVCLPCLARGIRELCKYDKKFKAKIKYVVTLLCNHVPTYHATEYLKEKYAVTQADKIKYRGNGWFGFWRLFRETDTGFSEYFSMSFSNYFSTGFSKYFWQRACAECQDHFGKYADIAMGDADFVKYRLDVENPGETMCFVNNPQINCILKDMCDEGLIELFTDFSSEEMERIYGPLCEQHRTGKESLKQNYKSILRKEKLRSFLIKCRLQRLVNLWERCWNCCWKLWGNKKGIG